MIYVDDEFFDDDFFEACFHAFDQHSVISRCKGQRIAVCISDVATWIALCLYVKDNGGSVFPLPIDTPLVAARRRAKLGHCHSLIFGAEALASGERCELLSDSPMECVGSLLQMSSGTTGDPKIIERSWSSIDIEIEAYITAAFPEANTMIPIVACPVSHSYGLICGVLVALKRVVRPVIVTNNNPKYIIRRARELGGSIIYSSPVLLGAIAMLVKESEPLYAVMTSGSVMQNIAFEKLNKKVTVIYQQYGCSEVGCISLAKGITSPHQVGKVLPHLKVSAGKDLEWPQEIIVRQPDGEEILTSDLGFFGDNNDIYYVSRIDDMINVAGFNVYPGEVEDVVLTMPAIADAVVFKCEHSLGYDQVCLNYVACGEVTNKDIRQWCRARLAAYQIPMNIHCVEVIPRLPNGKVNRKKLSKAIA